MSDEMKSAPVGVEAVGSVLQKLRRLALVIREHGACAPLALDHIGDDLERALAQQPSAASVGVAEAWQEGYRQGVLDERTSEDNIGIAGFGAKVEPARNNPYALAQQPAAVDGADTRRMDWLDGVAHCADWDDSGHDVMRRVIRADDGAEFCADTWREAIDMALAAQQGGRR